MALVRSTADTLPTLLPTSNLTRAHARVGEKRLAGTVLLWCRGGAWLDP